VWAPLLALDLFVPASRSPDPLLSLCEVTAAEAACVIAFCGWHRPEAAIAENVDRRSVPPERASERSHALVRVVVAAQLRSRFAALRRPWMIEAFRVERAVRRTGVHYDQVCAGPGDR